MPHGKTLDMKSIEKPEPRWVHQHLPAEGVFSAPPPATPYMNPDRDRALRGKARRRARRAARRAAR